MEKFNVFQFVNSINNKENCDIIKNHENEYLPYIINRSFSFFNDSVFYANELNKYSGIDNKLQFDFYYYILPKRRRYSKWIKKQITPETENIINLIINKYSCNKKTANEILNIFTDEQKNEFIKSLKSEAYTGGRK